MRARPSATLRGLAVAMLLGPGAACGPLRRGGPESEPALLVFTNESLDQADVFVITSGTHNIRIGTVLPGRTETLRVPADIVRSSGSVNVVARLLARSARPSSGPVAVHPGDRLTVRLPMDQKLLVVLPSEP